MANRTTRRLNVRLNAHKAVRFVKAAGGEGSFVASTAREGMVEFAVPPPVRVNDDSWCERRSSSRADGSTGAGCN